MPRSVDDTRIGVTKAYGPVAHPVFDKRVAIRVPDTTSGSACNETRRQYRILVIALRVCMAPCRNETMRNLSQVIRALEPLNRDGQIYCSATMVPGIESFPQSKSRLRISRSANAAQSRQSRVAPVAACPAPAHAHAHAHAVSECLHHRDKSAESGWSRPPIALP